MYKFYLNNTLVSEPKDWDEMVTSIKRDRTIKGMLVSQDLSVEFTNEHETDTTVKTGYTFLSEAFKADYTGEVSVLILRSIDMGATYKEFYKGIIFLPDIEFDRYLNTAKVKIRDNGYDARINNNKSIKISPRSSSSKNGAAITPVTVGQMDWFRCGSGATIQDDDPKDAIVYCYRVGDVLSHLIQYLSDGQMAFASTDFDAGGDFEDLVITTGRAFRKSVVSAFTDTTADFVQKFPGISLDDLLHDITRIADYSFIIENGQNPVFRLERESYFNEGTTLIECSNIEQIKERVELPMLYAKIKFGSGNIADHDYSSFVESARLIGFNKEEYAILGTSNIDNTLDLSLNYTTSSNVIEYIYENAIVNTDDSLDTDLFLVMTDGAANVYTPTKTNWVNPLSGMYYYNEALTNDKICSRFLGGVPNSISYPTAAANYRFKAEIRSQLVASDETLNVVIPNATNPIKFGGELSDIGSNYNPVTFRFICPEDGVYSFNVSLNLKSVATVSPGLFPYSTINEYIKLRRYDSGYNYITEHNSPMFSARLYRGINNYRTRQFHRSFTLETGDIVDVEYEALNTNAGTLGYEFYSILAGSYFELVATSIDGGVWSTYDPNLYPIIRHEFEYPVTDAQFKTILSNPRGKIKFWNKETEIKTGRIESLKMNHSKGIAKFIINSSIKPN